MGKTPYMIQGRRGEYTTRVIRRGARTAPVLENRLWIPATVDLCMQTIIQRKFCGDTYMQHLDLIVGVSTTVITHTSFEGKFLVVMFTVLPPV